MSVFRYGDAAEGVVERPLNLFVDGLPLALGIADPDGGGVLREDPEVKPMVLPLVATEWDIARGDADRWQRQINQAVACIESRCAAHCFYRIYTRDPGSSRGFDQISLFDRDARPVEPYHGLYRQALQAAGR